LVLCEKEEKKGEKLSRARKTIRGEGVAGVKNHMSGCKMLTKEKKKLCSTENVGQGEPWEKVGIR